MGEIRTLITLLKLKSWVNSRKSWVNSHDIREQSLTDVVNSYSFMSVAARVNSCVRVATKRRHSMSGVRG
jgi:hypothetical protein